MRIFWRHWNRNGIKKLAKDTHIGVDGLYFIKGVVCKAMVQMREMMSHRLLNIVGGTAIHDHQQHYPGASAKA